MNTAHYLKEFQSAQASIGNGEGLQLFTGIVLHSVVIKAFKPEWSNDPPNALTAVSRIFFSVWVSEDSIADGRLLYNIHALKLRQLSGYKIASRDFAEQFRKQFSPYAKSWPNNSIQYGPLTLMQGWVVLNDNTLQYDIAGLVQKFFKIVPLIDNTLLHYRVK